MNTPATDAVIEACLAFAREFPGCPLKEMTLERSAWVRLVHENAGRVGGLDGAPYIHMALRTTLPGVGLRRKDPQMALPFGAAADIVHVPSALFRTGIRFPGPTGYVTIKVDPASVADILESLK